MCLLIGSPGVGKTLLLKRLNACSNRGSYNNVGDVPATVPTVGTNLMNVVTSKKQEITVRELGGCMAPIWHSYYKDTPCIMFMIDMSNRQQISAACMQLLDVLSNPAVSNKAVLLILNKVDMPNVMKRLEFDSAMRLDDIIASAPQKVTLMEISAREGTGLAAVAKWIQEHGKAGS